MYVQFAQGVLQAQGNAESRVRPTSQNSTFAAEAAGKKKTAVSAAIIRRSGGRGAAARLGLLDGVGIRDFALAEAV